MTEVFRLDPPGLEELELITEGWVSGQLRTRLPAGEFYFRTLAARTDHLARRYAEQLFASNRPGRFTPIMNEFGKIVPIAYAAATEDVSLWETVLRTIAHRGVRRVPESETRDRHLVKVQTLEAFELIDLRRPKLYNLARDGRRAPDLSAAWDSGYPVTQQWAQGLYTRLAKIRSSGRSLTNADGFVYESHQVPGICVLIWRVPLESQWRPYYEELRAGFAMPAAEAFEQARMRVFAAQGVPRPVFKAPVREKLIRMALEAGASIDFGDDPDD